MLDLRHVMDHLEEVQAGLRRRSNAAAETLAPIAELGKKRRELIGGVETKQAQRNQANQAMAKADKKSPEFAQQRDLLKQLSADIKDAEKTLAEVEGEIQRLLAVVPNVPDPGVPEGKSDEDNPVVRTWGEKPSFAFTPKAHWDLGTGLQILDFERAAKLSGARFTVLFGAAARLERALISFMLDLHTREQGYLEVLPPFLVKDTALYGTGQLPKFEEDLFKTARKGDGEGDKSYDLYLIPTAEVPVTNLHADEVLEREQLPIAYAAFTPCFRAEAGSHGKDVRGLIRQHQFDKVELVRFSTPEDSAAQHELLTSHAEEVLKRLGLHYRVSLLCTGDMGFSSQRTYDIEVWLPGQNLFREISSCSNFGDFQARRAQIRYRPDPSRKIFVYQAAHADPRNNKPCGLTIPNDMDRGAATAWYFCPACGLRDAAFALAEVKDRPSKEKPRLVHTLNGSALAVGRTLIAVLEQYQQADGSIVVPEALRPYMGCNVIRGR